MNSKSSLFVLIFTFRTSTKFLQYENRYKTMVKEKKISPENVTRQINIYFQNTYEIVVLMRYAIRELRMNMNDIIAEEVRGVDQEGHQKNTFVDCSCCKMIN